MKKKIYENPTCKVVKIHSQYIICTSPSDPIPPDAPLWNGEGGARRRGNIDWDDEDDWEDK